MTQFSSDLTEWQGYLRHVSLPSFFPCNTILDVYWVLDQYYCYWASVYHSNARLAPLLSDLSLIGERNYWSQYFSNFYWSGAFFNSPNAEFRFQIPSAFMNTLLRSCFWQWEGIWFYSHCNSIFYNLVSSYFLKMLQEPTPFENKNIAYSFINIYIYV